MGVQQDFYSTDGQNKTFPSTKHIATKQHMAVWLRQKLDTVEVQLDPSKYELITNAAVLNSSPSTILYDRIEIRVADSLDELTSSPSAISVVAGIAEEVVTVAGIESEVVTVADDTVALNLVADDLAKGIGTNQPTDSAILNALTNATQTQADVVLAAASANEAAASAASVNNPAQTITELLSFDTSVGYVNVLGYHTANDGGGGLFNYDSTIDKSTANGGTIIDPSVSLALQGTGVGFGCWVRQYSGAVNVRWFGAVCDGVTDDTTNYNLIVSYVNSRVHTSIKLSGEILIGGEINTITSGVSIDGGGADILLDNDTSLSFSNQSYLSYVLTSDCDTYFFDVTNRDSLGIEVGDIFKIKSDTLWRHDNRGELTYGELQKVAFLPDSNTNVLVSLQGSAPSVIGEFNFYEQYTISTNTIATFYKPKKLNIKNLTINGKGVATRSLSITGYDNPIVDNVTFLDFLDTSAGVSTCYSPLFNNCDITTNYINYTTSGTGYGVQFSGCRGAIFTNGSASNVRRGVDFSGFYPSIGGGVFNSYFNSCSSSAFGTHGTAYEVSFNNNTASFVSSLALLRGERLTVSGNSVENCSYIATVSYGYGNTITNNNARKALAGVWYTKETIDAKISETALDLKYDTFSNNTIDEVVYGLARFGIGGTNTKFNGFILRGNTITRVEGGSITSAITSDSAGVDLTGYTIGNTCVIEGNHVDYTSSYSGFFDRNVTIELDAVINNCWYSNLATAMTAVGNGGVGSAVLDSMAHNSFSLRKGQLKGQFDVTVTVSGGGVNDIYLYSDIFREIYSGAGDGYAYTEIRTSSGIHMAQIYNGSILIHKDVDRGGSFADATYKFTVQFDHQTSLFRVSMPNIL